MNLANVRYHILHVHMIAWMKRAIWTWIWMPNGTDIRAAFKPFTCRDLCNGWKWKWMWHDCHTEHSNIMIYWLLLSRRDTSFFRCTTMMNGEYVWIMITICWRQKTRRTTRGVHKSVHQLSDLSHIFFVSMRQWMGPRQQWTCHALNLWHSKRDKSKLKALRQFNVNH